MEMEVRYFNSQPHKEADSNSTPAHRHRFLFQLTASQGGWPYPVTITTALFGISTHSLTRRLTASVLVYRNRHVDFNSQPHKEADIPVTSVRFSPPISTHSLTRRLTTERSALYHANIISTHSLTRRLTIFTSKHLPANLFQLTASQGGWQPPMGWIYSKIFISTHSLTRRLTIMCDKHHPDK